MARKRKAKHDTVATEAAIAAALQTEIDPPEHVTLPPDALLRFRLIVRARAQDTWNELDLEHAANLACCLADLERLREEVRAEGDVIENQRGTQIVNPKHTLMEVLSRRSVALSRMLHVHAEATQGRARDTGERTKKERDLRDALADASLDDEDLLGGRPEYRRH